MLVCHLTRYLSSVSLQKNFTTALELGTVNKRWHVQLLMLFCASVQRSFKLKVKISPENKAVPGRSHLSSYRIWRMSNCRLSDRHPTRRSSESGWLCVFLDSFIHCLFPKCVAKSDILDSKPFYSVSMLWAKRLDKSWCLILSNWEKKQPSNHIDFFSAADMKIIDGNPVLSCFCHVISCCKYCPSVMQPMLGS